MKKLCKQCDIRLYCESTCEEAAKFEKQDNSSNYSKEKYIAKPTSITGFKIMAGQYD